MKIVIIDYDGGNVCSVINALAAIFDVTKISVSKNLQEIAAATHLILPGVGAFGDCVNGLRAVDGLVETLKKEILIKQKPLLGICVGMQVFAEIGFENGQHSGLNLIGGKVEKLQPQGLKVPHMGWNELIVKNKNHKIFAGISSGDHVYFANSYHFICEDQNHVLAQVEYGTNINAVIAKNNILGIQFHPEKSGVVGLQILKNFINL